MCIRMNEEVKIVMEATGIYHLPVATYLKEHGLFVSAINPYEMKQYRTRGLRKVKTDRADLYWSSIFVTLCSINIYM